MKTVTVAALLAGDGNREHSFKSENGSAAAAVTGGAHGGRTSLDASEKVEYKIVEEDWAADLPQHPDAETCSVYMQYGGCECVSVCCAPALCMLVSDPKQQHLLCLHRNQLYSLQATFNQN